jgi:hypothetical protein
MMTWRKVVPHNDQVLDNEQKDGGVVVQRVSATQAINAASAVMMVILFGKVALWLASHHASPSRPQPAAWFCSSFISRYLRRYLS